ncbi:MAG: nuclear transport factor 2 family protein [Ktedonobacteraceae bacterium]|nr:nuclear transport factor 2 family protein [Ktedonobacteraceae bacterium]
MQMNSRKEFWETYAQAWSVTDRDRRQQLLDQSVSPECIYTDPLIQVQGYDALSNYMETFQKNTPGAAFVTTNLQEHHDQSLAQWNMVNGEGKVLSPGASFARYDADGRLKQMTGFSSM